MAALPTLRLPQSWGENVVGLTASEQTTAGSFGGNDPTWNPDNPYAPLGSPPNGDRRARDQTPATGIDQWLAEIVAEQVLGKRGDDLLRMAASFQPLVFTSARIASPSAVRQIPSNPTSPAVPR